MSGYSPGLWASDKNRSKGVGKEATEASRTIVRRFKGLRLVVAGQPSAAIDVAIAQLLAEGFVLRPDDLDQALRQRSSWWIGRTVEIGDVNNAKRLWWQNFFFGENGDMPCTLLWGWMLRRGIAPTLVAVVARPAAAGQSELVISPVPSGLGPYADRGAAEPRLTRALRAVELHFTQVGQLLQQPEDIEPLLLDAECPAQEKTLKALITWPQTKS